MVAKKTEVIKEVQFELKDFSQTTKRLIERAYSRVSKVPGNRELSFQDFVYEVTDQVVNR